MFRYLKKKNCDILTNFNNIVVRDKTKKIKYMYSLRNSLDFVQIVKSSD